MFIALKSVYVKVYRAMVSLRGEDPQEALNIFHYLEFSPFDTVHRKMDGLRCHTGLDADLNHCVAREIVINGVSLTMGRQQLTNLEYKSVLRRALREGYPDNNSCQVGCCFTVSDTLTSITKKVKAFFFLENEARYYDRNSNLSPRIL